MWKSYEPNNRNFITELAVYIKYKFSDKQDLSKGSQNSHPKSIRKPMQDIF